MRKIFLLFVPFVLMGCVLLSYAIRKHPEFAISKIMAIEQGMYPDEIKALFGDPDRITTRPMGSETDSPWLALEWIYMMGEHPRGEYQYIDNYNRFFFDLDYDPPLLSNWFIELSWPD